MLLDTLLAEPNVRWCEAHVAGPLLEPGNCASSLAYLVALPLGARGDGQLSRSYAVVGLLVALTSFAYHATWTVGTQIMDFLGIFALLGWLVARAAVRRGQISERRALPVAAAWTVASIVVWTSLMLEGLPHQLLVIAQVVVALALNVRPDVAPPLRVGVVLLSLGFAASIADMSRLWCFPDAHLAQGHAAWHVLSAAGLAFVARQDVLDARGRGGVDRYQRYVATAQATHRGEQAAARNWQHPSIR